MKLGLLKWTQITLLSFTAVSCGNGFQSQNRLSGPAVSQQQGELSLITGQSQATSGVKPKVEISTSKEQVAANPLPGRDLSPNEPNRSNDSLSQSGALIQNPPQSAAVAAGDSAQAKDRGQAEPQAQVHAEAALHSGLVSELGKQIAMSRLDSDALPWDKLSGNQKDISTNTIRDRLEKGDSKESELDAKSAAKAAGKTVGKDSSQGAGSGVGSGSKKQESKNDSKDGKDSDQNKNEESDKQDAKTGDEDGKPASVVIRQAHFDYAGINRVAVKDAAKLKALQDQQLLALFNGGIYSANSAEFSIADAADGHFCQVQSSQNLQDRSELILAHFTDEISRTDRIERILRMEFSNSRSQSLIIQCQYRGSLDWNDLRRNLSVILTLSQSKNPQVGQDEAFEELSAEQAAVESERSNSFRIISIEKLQRLITTNNKGEIQNAVLQGEIVPYQDGLKNFASRKSSMICYIENFEPGIQKDDVFAVVDRQASAQSVVRGAVTIKYFFVNKNTHLLRFACLTRKETGIKALFQTFKGIFEFGVVDQSANKIAHDAREEMINELRKQKLKEQGF